MTLHAFSLWDFLLIAGVCAQATALAYCHNPRHKALVYGLPIATTLAVFAVGRPIDATNVLGLVLLLLYNHTVRVLYGRGWPIVAAIAAGVTLYCGIAMPLAAAVPSDENTFRLTALCCMVFGLVLLWLLPVRIEPGHRTPLPVWIKIPTIILIVTFLVVIKSRMHGFATVFPMVGAVGAYEARHSLWTFGRQVPIAMLTAVPMMLAWRTAEPWIGTPAAAALGWLVFGITLGALSKFPIQPRPVELNEPCATS